MNAMDPTARGIAAGKADLVNGKVPTSQLPSYVDEVVEYDTLSDFPATGESGKIYIAKDTNKTYRWGGTTYVAVGGAEIATASVAGLIKPGTEFDVAADGTLSTYTAIAVTSASCTNATQELGSVVTATTISWATNKTPTTLTVDGVSEDVTHTSKALTGLSISADRTFTVAATDARGASASKSCSIKFYRYAYSLVSSSTTAPTSGCTKESTISTFAQSGKDFTYAVGDYIWLLTTSASAKIQQYVAGQWADVTTVSAGAVTLTLANGTTATYYAYRTGRFSGAGTAKYRIV